MSKTLIYFYILYKIQEKFQDEILNMFSVFLYGFILEMIYLTYLKNFYKFAVVFNNSIENVYIFSLRISGFSLINQIPNVFSFFLFFVFYK